MFRVLTVKKFAGELYHPYPDEPARNSSSLPLGGDAAIGEVIVQRFHQDPLRPPANIP